LTNYRVLLRDKILEVLIGGRMKINRVKALLNKRLLTLLMIPVIVGSNFATIQVSADEEAVVAASTDGTEDEAGESNTADENGEQGEAGDKDDDGEGSDGAGEGGGSENENGENGGSGDGNTGDENNGGEAGDEGSTEASEAASESSTVAISDDASNESSDEASNAGSGASEDKEDEEDVSGNSSTEDEEEEDVSGNSGDISGNSGDISGNSEESGSEVEGLFDQLKWDHRGPLSGSGVQGDYTVKIKNKKDPVLELTVTIPFKEPSYNLIKWTEGLNYCVSGFAYIDPNGCICGYTCEFEKKDTFGDFDLADDHYEVKFTIPLKKVDKQGDVVLSDYVKGLRIVRSDSCLDTCISFLDLSGSGPNPYSIHDRVPEFDPSMVLDMDETHPDDKKNYYFVDENHREGFVSFIDESYSEFSVEVVGDSQSTGGHHDTDAMALGAGTGSSDDDELIFLPGFASLTGAKEYYPGISKYQVVLGKENEEGEYRLKFKLQRQGVNSDDEVVIGVGDGGSEGGSDSSSECSSDETTPVDDKNTKIITSDNVYIVDCTKPVFEYSVVGSDGQTSAKAVSTKKTKKKPLSRVKDTDDEDGQVDNDVPCYSGVATVKLYAKEKWLDSCNSVATIKRDGDVVYSTSWNNKTEEDGNTHTSEYRLTEDGEYTITYKLSDKVGHSVNSTEDKVIKFYYDSTPPKFSAPIANDDVKPKNEKYYNQARVITVPVAEANMTYCKVNVTKGNEADVKVDYPDFSSKKLEKNVVITFDKDGTYDFTVTVEDKGGASVTSDPYGEFVIDTTKPEVKNVTFNNNNVKNGMYYNSARVASINIADKNLGKDAVTVNPTLAKDGAALPPVKLGGGKGDSNIANMSFTADGTYEYTVQVEDLAGNVSDPYTVKKFIIDTTAPEVKFSGVENFSANNGTVAPVAVYTDKNMDMDSAVVTLVGANHGEVNLGTTPVKTENGFTLNIEDFEHKKEVDDLYTLDVKASDLAGNTSIQKLVFSVNRFGSVFVLGDGTKALNEKYYVNKPQDVVVTEINVDDLILRDVSVTRDGSLSKLSNERDYVVSKQGNDESWKTYTYNVGRANFTKDGVYSVSIYTKDRATNVQDNKSRDAEIEFAVDATAPSIVVAGIEDGGIYEEEKHQFNIDVTDNMGLVDMTVYNNGKTLKTYTGKQIEADGNLETITLSESDKTHNITLVATDVAGNTQTVQFKDILVSTKKEDIEKVEEAKEEVKADLPEVKAVVKDNTEVDNGNKNDAVIEPPVVIEKDHTKVIVIVMLGAVCLVAAGGAGFMLRKKKMS
jgi:hypothetical protein